MTLLDIISSHKYNFSSNNDQQGVIAANQIEYRQWLNEEIHTFHNLAFHHAHEWAALLHFSLQMEAPTWAAAGGRVPSWPGWIASAWPGKIEPGLELWSPYTDWVAAELRTASSKNNCQLLVETQ